MLNSRHLYSYMSCMLFLIIMLQEFCFIITNVLDLFLLVDVKCLPSFYGPLCFLSSEFNFIFREFEYIYSCSLAHCRIGYYFCIYLLNTFIFADLVYFLIQHWFSFICMREISTFVLHVPWLLYDILASLSFLSIFIFLYVAVWSNC